MECRIVFRRRLLIMPLIPRVYVEESIRANALEKLTAADLPESHKVATR